MTKKYDGPEIYRVIVKECPVGKHCYCRKDISGQAYCCVCGYTPVDWLEIDQESIHNTHVMRKIRSGK